MKSSIIYNLVFIIICSTTFNLSAQDETPLSVQHKIYAKGGSVVVGNTIIGKHKSKSFDSEKTSNDVINMVYVDVDVDPETFSSSSANVAFPDGSTKILYAALYWSGLYPAEKSTMRLGKKRAYYKKKGDRQEAVDSVKIKLGDQPYINIKGAVIFDAKGKGKYRRDSPYVCRADITKYLKDTSLDSFTFTVANVRAVLGKLQGGSAAGWHLYVVYENLNSSPKYFTTFDGFRQVAKDPVEITFSDFQTKTLGAIESTLVMAALEGDIKIKSDQCAIFSKTDEKYIILQTPIREGDNFFKSSITIYSEMFLDRNPLSKNTLGFDLLKMKLADGLIANNAEEAKIRFKSKADRFYIYFTAFETEIEETLMLEKNPEAIVLIDRTEIPAIAETVEKETPLIIPMKASALKMSQRPALIEEEVVVEKEYIKEKTKQRAALTSVSAVKTNVAVLNEPLDEETKISEEKQPILVEKVKSIPAVKEEASNNLVLKINVEGMISGYFLVTNVFSQEKLAEKWMTYLLKEGYNPEQFINPKNGWFYVYILRTDSLIELKEKAPEFRIKKYFKDSWITRIN
jgi:hypothetical protein